MSLICARCGHIIVMSNNPDHLGVCAACGPTGMTEEEKRRIEESGKAFHQASVRASQERALREHNALGM